MNTSEPEAVYGSIGTSHYEAPNDGSLTEIIAEAALRIGARFQKLSDNAPLGMLFFSNGTTSPVMGNLALNSAVSSRIAQDKQWTKDFLRCSNVPTPRGRAFYTETLRKKHKLPDAEETASDFATRLGFPVIVKPNRLARGKSIQLVRKKEDVDTAIKSVWAHDGIALVEAYVPGNDYRITLLDDNVFAAYQRFPLSVKGDGRSSIHELLVQKQGDFEAMQREEKIDMEDPRILAELHERRLTLTSVLSADQGISLLPCANVSTGGTARNIEKELHPDFIDLALKTTKAIGLTYSGVDIRAQDISRSCADQVHAVLEVNSQPALHFYVRPYDEVVDQYAKVLRLVESQVSKKQ